MTDHEKPPPVKVILGPGLTVTIEAHEALDVVAAKALALFHEVADKERSIPVGPAVGFTGDRVEQGLRGHGSQWHQISPTSEAKP